MERTKKHILQKINMFIHAVIEAYCGSENRVYKSLPKYLKGFRKNFKAENGLIKN